ncbi:protein aubergine [Uranotaenia lowii]|uniref:protein aubergine n=1 Tax=Uranotaenia lowii TaxID=190385 RepID=UPI00247A2320|nr:protein aubergine [Uranotaenia lowii]
MADRQTQGRARARGYTAVNLSHEGREGRGQASTRGSGVAPYGGQSQGPRPAWGPGPSEGRATAHRDQSAGRSTGSSGDNGNGSSSGGTTAGGVPRGALRGRRSIGDTLRTRALDAPSKHGTTGTPLQLHSNYFKLLKHIEWTLFQYRVDISPQVASARLLQGLVNEHKKLFGGFLFDGTQLFMVNKLRSDQLTLQSRHERTGEVYQLRIVHTGTVDMTNETGIQVLNLILRRAMAGLNLQLVGRNLFDAAAKIAIREYQIELWPGYITSIRQHEQDILVCCEVAHKTMRMQTCYDILRDCQKHDRNYKDGFKRAVLGVVVLTSYNNKTYTIHDVTFDTTPESTFDTKAGKTSFLEYYKTKYNIRIRDPHQPMLLSRAKKRDLRAGGSELMALVPELCQMTGLTDQMRSDFRMMRAMADHTRLNPDRRIERLETFNRRLQTSPESCEVFKTWQMELDRRLVELPGRLLPQEMIFFSTTASGVQAGENADWTAHFRNNPMFATVRLNRWYLIVPNRATREANDFLGCMIQAARGMRFEISNCEVVPIPDDNPGTYVRTLDNVLNKDPQMIMCVVSNNKADRYTAIKKKCCVDRAIPTQVMVQKTITPKGGNVRTLMSVATKVVIQMNCKLGGVPWKVKIPLNGLMTIGFDVCHDAKDKAKSFGAMVATLDHDNKGTPKFFSTVSQHTHGEEISNYLPINTVKALNEYRKEYGELPKRIIFYRDGVGEGQLHYIYEHEVKSIVEKLNHIYKSAGAEQDVLLTFFIVNKRINTRFFDHRQNPKPGTVVDDIVTLPERTDFYLVSQSVRQGTVSPTAYNVIYDTSGLKIDHLQMLSYKQCHLYYNWSGTTRVPAVCQYAHKLSFLVAQFLHQAPSNLLEKKLFFL